MSCKGVPQQAQRGQEGTRALAGGLGRYHAHPGSTSAIALTQVCWRNPPSTGFPLFS